MYTPDRTRIRQFFIQAWRKHRSQAELEGLERLVVSVIQQHPEYQALLESDDSPIDREFTPESGGTNPFLHMGMHITIQEQISTNRPAGITKIHQQEVHRTGDAHRCEHQMMECLGEMLWQAQRNGLPLDEQAYLECLRNRLPS